MIDIEFYQRIHTLKKALMNGEYFTADEVFDALEWSRNEDPVVYNIETTNDCNQRCKMCPRTTLMNRPVTALSLQTIERIADQIKPWTSDQWDKWEKFVKTNYGIGTDVMSENHFFLYIIAGVVVLHGYGDPILDPNIAKIVSILKKRNIRSYFSRNPANINWDRVLELLDAGLDWIKFSAPFYSEDFRKVFRVLDWKEKRGYRTGVVVTLVDVGEKDEDWVKLSNLFTGAGVYFYIKSQDQRWLSDNPQETGAIHWSEFCQFPWSSMSISSSGAVVPCCADYNDELVMGDCKTDSLYDIWNGDKYRQFRRNHLSTPHEKCAARCDMKTVGGLVR